MIEKKHLGVYGLVINEDKILLIKKVNGPYDGKLDLPGGSIEFGERPEDALKREFKEEVGIDLVNYELIDADSITFKWKYNEDVLNWQHIGIFYNILDYSGDVRKNINIDSVNDDSLGADFYNIKGLNKAQLSYITIMILEKMGYKINEMD